MKLSNKRISDVDKMILGVAKKLSDEKYVHDILKTNNSKYKSFSLAISYPALCILFSELQYHFPEYEFDICAHKYLETINTDLGNSGTNDISLFEGLCGVGFSAYCMSHKGERYQSFINNLNCHIVNNVKTRLLEYKNSPLNELQYDVMYGLTGMGNYLMNFAADKMIRNSLCQILQFLTDLCENDFQGIPRFAIHSSQSPLFRYSREPSAESIKYVNLGISHGIPGILLLLVRSYREGIYVKNQFKAIEFLANYIYISCVRDRKEYFWEAQKILGENNKKKNRARDAWCYGTPGVAYSLLKASQLLKNDKMKELAICSMKVSLQHLQETVSSTFCHGFSGLCCLARKFHEETEESYFLKAYTSLFEHILSLYNAEYPFGFTNKEMEQGSLIERNEIGLLNGVSGVLLTLLSCYKAVYTPWESIFLL